MTDLKQLNKAIVDGDAKKAVEVTKAALAEGAKPLDLIQNNMIPAMDEVGKLFEEEDVFRSRTTPVGQSHARRI